MPDLVKLGLHRFHERGREVVDGGGSGVAGEEAEQAAGHVGQRAHRVEQESDHLTEDGELLVEPVDAVGEFAGRRRDAVQHSGDGLDHIGDRPDVRGESFRGGGGRVDPVTRPFGGLLAAVQRLAELFQRAEGVAERGEYAFERVHPRVQCAAVGESVGEFLHPFGHAFELVGHLLHEVGRDLDNRTQQFRGALGRVEAAGR